MELDDLTKKKWNEMKKEAKLAKKSKFEAFLTKLTGLNVGDKIKKFQKARKNRGTSYDNWVKFVNAAKTLQDALKEYVDRDVLAVSDPEIVKFKKEINGFIETAKEYHEHAQRFIEENGDALKNAEAQRLQALLKKAGILS